MKLGNASSHIRFGHFRIHASHAQAFSSALHQASSVSRHRVNSFHCCYICGGAKFVVVFLSRFWQLSVEKLELMFTAVSSTSERR
jgi:hypothetical protein